MFITAVSRTTSAFKNGLLALGLLTLAGCQTTSDHQTANDPNGIGQSGQIASSDARKAKALARLQTIESNEPYTLWARIRNGFMLDPAVIDNPRIDQQRLVFASQPRYFELASARSQRYLHYVVEQIDAREMPLELALLPFVESSYNPMAYSSSHAAGLWQFIPSTGKVYSLRQDWWYDGRRDVTASTQAALDYLTRLNKLFDGDWLLAMAAYNCGEGCVGRAIKRNESLGLPTDYWNLQLPRETMNYVPKLLAMAQIIESPASYNMALPALEDAPYFVEITIDEQLDLHKAAELASISTEEILSLNPAFKQRVTAPQGPYQLLVPVATAEQFSTALALLPAGERVSYQRYNVRSGDTLSQIARRYQVTLGALREVNNIDGHTIRIGQTLMLPHSAGGAPGPAAVETLTAADFTYQVKPGDNLWTIAKRHGLSVSALRQHNSLSGPNLSVGQKLVLPGQAGSSSSSSSSTQGRKLTYIVKAGDSLYSIARRYNVQINNIKEWNQLGPVLHPGQQLILRVL
ncbi:hypothetical protein LCGC14_0116550 [marine sediment metagenome]